MNSEQMGTPVQSRTSALAIAAFVTSFFSCLCIPAPIAIVLAIIALVQMGKDPLLKGKGFAIAALIIPVPMIILMSAAVAIPNFIKFQARAKQSECKANLRSIYTAERSFRAEYDRYSQNFEEIRFPPPPGRRYSYLLSAHPEVEGTFAPADREDSVLPTAKIIGLLPDSLQTTVGMTGECPDCEFTAVCIGQIDRDDTLDVWSVSSVSRKGPDGETIEPGVPYNDVNDTRE